MRTIESTSIAQTQAVGQALARCAQAGDLIGLVGELGAGKTQFVRGLATGLAIDPNQVASPTFVLCREYQAEHSPLTLVHIDAYRLTGPNDLQTIGWGETGEELREQALTVIEWADRVDQDAGALDEDRLTVQLEHTHHGRRITLMPAGSWIERINRLTLHD